MSDITDALCERQQELLIDRLIANTPAGLKAMDRWILWRYENRDGTPTKVPLTVAGYRADTTDPAHWASFDAALCALEARGMGGVGFVFAEGDGLFGIDLDSLDALAPEYLAGAEALRGALFEDFPTYWERSPSGKGWHAIGRGTIPASFREKRVALECYVKERFFTMTGRAVPGRETINDCQANLTALYNRFGAGQVERRAVDFNRPDQRPVDEIVKHIRSWQNGQQFSWLLDTPPEQIIVHYGGDHSAADYALANYIANATWDVEKALAIFARSGLYRVTKGGYRNETAYRYDYLVGKTLNQVWLERRNKDELKAQAIEHGAQLARQLQASPSPIKEPAAKVKTSTSDKLGFTPFIRADSPAPFVFDALVKATAQTMRNPSAKYAELACLATLSGMVGRRYSFEGKTLALFMLIGGHSGAGKSQAQKAVLKVLEGALRADGDLQVAIQDMRKRVWHTQYAASAQGLLEQLREAPATVWTTDEAQTAVDLLSGRTNTKSASEQAVVQMMNSLFDAGPGEPLATPASVAGKTREKEGGKVHSVSCSLYWSTQYDRLMEALDGAMVTSGAMSRLLVMFVGDQLAPTNRGAHTMSLDGATRGVLMSLFQMIAQTDQMLATAPNPAAYVSVEFKDQAAEQLYNAICDAADDNTRAAQRERHQRDRLILGRVGMNVGRVAALGATLDNPAHPQITHEHLYWACSIVMPAALGLYEKVSQSEIGDGGTAELRKAQEVFRALLESPANDVADLGLVKHHDFKTKLTDAGLFKRHAQGKTRAAGQAIDDLADAGWLIEVGPSHPQYPHDRSSGRGRLPIYYSIN